MTQHTQHTGPAHLAHLPAPPTRTPAVAAPLPPPEQPPRFKIPQLDGAQWMAGLGALLVSAAAIALLSDQWQQLTAIARLAMMVTATIIVGGAGQMLRASTPTTARALQLLAGLLVALDAGAIFAVAGFAWPVSTLAAGVAGLAAAEFVRRADTPGSATTIDVLIVVAGAVTAAGLAATAGFPAAVIMALMGATALLYPQWRYAAEGWAAIAALSALVYSLEGSSNFVGRGTLHDMGLLGTVVSWSAPIAAVVAAAVFVQRWFALGDKRRLVAAAVSILLGIVVAFSTFQPPAEWALVAIAALFLLVEAAALALRDRHGSDPRFVNSLNLIEWFVGAPLTLILIVAGLGASVFDEAVTSWVLGAIIAACAWGVAGARERSLAYAPAAGALAMAALWELTESFGIAGSVLLTAGAAAAAYGFVKRDAVALVSGLFGAVGGFWMVGSALVDDPSSALFWLLPPALALVLFDEYAPRPSWMRWGPALAIVAIAAITDYINTDQTLYLNTLTVIAALSGAYGAIARRSTPLLAGSAIAVGTAGWQMLDATVGVEGWGWLGLTGAVLLAVAGLFEWRVRPHIQAR